MQTAVPTSATPPPVGQIVQLPLAELTYYANARSIDPAHVAKLGRAIADPADLMAEPLEVYVDATAPNAMPNRVGVYVVLNGAHRVKALSHLDPSVKVPCLIVEKPSSADDSFLRATSSNTRAENARAATFSDKVESMVAARDLLESDDVAITKVKELKDAADLQNFPLPAFVKSPEAHQVFKTSRGLRSFSRGELSRRSVAGVDTRAYECFLAFSGRSLELGRLINGEERQMYRRFDAAAPTSAFGTHDVSLVYAIMNVPMILEPAKQDPFARMLYLLVVAKILTSRDGMGSEAVLGVAAVGGPRPSKRAKTKYQVVPVRSPEFQHGSAALKCSPPRSKTKLRPADVLATRIEHVVKAFDHIAVRCGFPSAERMLLPAMVWDKGAMRLAGMPAGRTRRASAGMRWSLYGSKVIGMEDLEAGELSCVPSQSWAEEFGDLERLLQLPREAANQICSLSTAFIKEVWETAADTLPQAKAAAVYADFASLPPNEAGDDRLPDAAKKALKRATALAVIEEGAIPPVPSPPSATSSEQESPPSAPEPPAPQPEPAAPQPEPAASQPEPPAPEPPAPGSPAPELPAPSGPGEPVLPLPSSSAGEAAASGSTAGPSTGTRSKGSSHPDGGPGANTGPTPPPPPAPDAADTSATPAGQAGASAAVGTAVQVGFVDSDAFPWRLDRSSFESWHRYEGLAGRVQLVLTDPPYGVRTAARETRGAISAANLSPIGHDVLDAEQMGTAAQKIIDLLRPGGHAVVFCSVQQLPQWVACLGKGGHLKVDQMPMVFPKAPSAYFSFARISTTLVNCFEVAVHATKAAKDFKTAEGMVNYRERMSTSRNRYTGWTNVVESGSGLGLGERVYVQDPEDPNRRKLHIRPEQKSVTLMQELVHRFSQPQDFVVDLFAGTASTAVACLSMPDGGFRHFAGCEIDETCWQAASNRIKKAFALEVSRDNLHGCTASSRGSVEKECRAVLAGESSSLSNSAGVCPYSAGLPPHSPLPEHLLSYLATRWKDEKLLSRAGVPPPEWPEEHHSLRLCDDWEELLAVDASCQGIRVGKSSICGADEGLFAARKMRKGEVICWYGGTYVYEDLGKETSSHREHGPVGFGVSKLEFRARGLAVELCESALDKLAKVRSAPALEEVWIVASKFCAGGKVNDPTFVSGVDRMVEGGKGRKANAEFVEVKDIDLQTLRADPYLARLEALTDIASGEEILASYGSLFWK